MRLKEPFRGLYLMAGHTIFHVALLVAGVFNIGFHAVDEKNEDTIFTINYLRVAHGIEIFVAILKIIGHSPELFAKHRFTLRVFDTIKLFVYLGSILYAIFHEQKVMNQKNDDLWYKRAELWILLELLVFFGQVLCSVFYLFGLQIKGEFGLSNDPLFERYKQDTLEYYDADISWFSFIFVMWSVHLFVLVNNEDVQIGKEEDGMKLFYSAYSLILRSAQLYFLMPHRSAKRDLTVISKNTWAILMTLQLIGGCFTFAFKNVKGMATASAEIDVIVFLGQMAQYFVHYKREFSDSESKPDQAADEQQQLVEAPAEPKPKRVCGSRKDKVIDECVLDDSIFDLAFASLLDPAAMEQWQRDHPGQYLQAIKLDRVESTSVFQGMLICVMIQVCAVYLLVLEFSSNLSFKNDKFLLLIPKLISCFYMHHILAEEIKDGMKIMKYTINHPRYFERAALDLDTSEITDRTDGKYTRILYGFMIGLIQWGIAVTLEIMSIIFLNSLDSYRLIIVCYASLTAIAHFDNMFASALDSHPIKAASNQKLCVTYNRYMHMPKVEGDDGEQVLSRSSDHQSTKRQDYPRAGCFMKLLRLIYKLIRVFHVSFFFYFTPFLMLFYQFYSFDLNE